jgi:hypothetical protein
MKFRIYKGEMVLIYQIHHKQYHCNGMLLIFDKRFQIRTLPMESCSASTVVDTEFRLVQIDSDSADLLRDNKLVMARL